MFTGFDGAILFALRRKTANSDIFKWTDVSSGVFEGTWYGRSAGRHV